MFKKFISVLAALFLGKIQAQLCSCGGSIQQLIANPLIVPSGDFFTSPFNLPQIVSAFADSSVPNCLANTLQLMIVSDLIASNLNSRRKMSPCVLPPVSPICPTLSSPQIFTPTVEFAPRTDFFHTTCAPVVDIVQPHYSCIEPLPNVYGVADILSSVSSLTSTRNSEVIPANTNFLPIFGPVSLKDIAVPIQMGSSSSCFCNGLPELLGPVTEVIYPPGVPPCIVGSTSPPGPTANLQFEPIPYTGVNYFY